MVTVKNFFKALLYTLTVNFSGLMKVSFLVGSYAIWFSAVNITVPLAGAFGGVMGCGLIFIVRQFIHFLLFKTVSLSFLALCVPGFCASLYWATNHYVVRLLLPSLCLLLFVVHPVGAQAFVYSLYWLIPIGLYFIPQRSLFWQAIGSTLVAHAVGSVIWLYTMPTTVSLWLGLMPIVFVERIFFALGMVVAYRIIAWLFINVDNVDCVAQHMSAISNNQ